MRIASWNVNSIRARMPRVLHYLSRTEPDVLCLQETKVRDELFPHEEFSQLGYTCVYHGQAAYNGVAILARGPLKSVEINFQDEDEPDTHARLITAEYQGVKIASCYVPNGQEMQTPQAEYKKRFYARLRRKIQSWGKSSAPAVIVGDFNVAPRAEDVYDVKRWEKTVLFHPEMRAHLASLIDTGLTDVFAKLHPEPGNYSWWDYRHNNFATDRGLRIDLILANQALFKHLKSSHIDKDERAGEKPSDHVPVVAEFSL